MSDTEASVNALRDDLDAEDTGSIEIFASEEDSKRVKLCLNSPANTRKSIARVLRMVMRDELNQQKARTLCLIFGRLNDAWRLEKDMAIETRIEEIERILTKMTGGKV